MTKSRIIGNPDQWIITRQGDFVKIKDSEIQIEENLTKIREHLKKPYKGVVRFKGKTDEQISKERYDKVLEEVNFDYDKFHDWIYDEKNKDKVEIIKLQGQELQEAVKAIFNHIKSSKQKWRAEIINKDINWNLQNRRMLINEETGQVIYPLVQVDEEYSKLVTSNRKLMYKNGVKIKRKAILIDEPDEWGSTERGEANKYSSVLIFLHGTYGAGSLNQIAEKFPGLKIIHLYSPILQYDMWHDSRPAPGDQEQGWINITGDVFEIMENDVVINNSSRVNYEDVDKSIHLDYPQLMRAVNYINEIIEREIIKKGRVGGIPPEKIFVAGYSQGGLLTLTTALTSKHKLGGFISLCGLLPARDKLLKITSDKNKETPTLIVNNSKDPWIPLWAGQKTYEILKNRGYNVEFNSRPGLGYAWKDEDIIKFLEKCLSQTSKPQPRTKTDTGQKIAIALGILVVVIIIIFNDD